MPPLGAPEQKDSRILGHARSCQSKAVLCAVRSVSYGRLSLGTGSGRCLAYASFSLPRDLRALQCIGCGTRSPRRIFQQYPDVRPVAFII